jgi:hypothetical protein
MGSGPALHLTTMLPQEAGTTSCVCTGVRCVVPGPRTGRGVGRSVPHSGHSDTPQPLGFQEPVPRCPRAWPGLLFVPKQPLL